MALLAAFGSQDDVLPKSLDYMAAVTPSDQWMNNMGTYMLWWVRNVAEWYRFTGDLGYLRKHHRYLADTVNHMVAHVTASNTFEGIRRPFLDWPTEHNRKAVFAGVQGLAKIAFEEAAFLGEALGDADLVRTCRGAAKRVAWRRRTNW